MLKNSLYLTLIIFSIMMLHSCNSRQKVDTIITNATIYSVDENFSIHSAMAIDDGKIISIGSNEKIVGNYTAETKLDMSGKYIYPGLIDPHCHFYGYSTTLANVDLSGTNSIEEIIDRAKEYQKTNPTGWITGRGWDQNDWEIKEFPSKEILDSVFPDIPVFFRRIDGHAAWANSKALELAKITGDTKIDGGRILLSNGEPTGILIDMAIDLVKNIIPGITQEETIQYLKNAQDTCFSYGLTSVGDAGLSKESILLLDSMQKSGEIKMRIYAMIAPSNENIEHFLKKGHYKTDHINVRSLKLYADGALGSRGACLLEEYSDDPGNIGLLVTDIDSLKYYSKLCYEYDYQVCTHCIGDSANRTMLKIYAENLKEKNDKRWRIEHAQIIHPDDFSIFGDYCIIPSIQTTHCTSDMYWAIDRIGDKRIENAYAWRKLFDENGWLPNGSDFPVEKINPILGFYAAITRQDIEGKPNDGFYLDQMLTREEALKATTIWAAKAQFEEKEKGSLEVGKLADFIILSKDIMRCPVNEIFSEKVEQTYSNGKKVFDIND
ncbi:MAG: amidohydrolase [Candidatus Parabeggiatoa sp. nov. 2]|nr:MAG: amidohydrolase [Beggiatoa sp. 4572_84]